METRVYVICEKSFKNQQIAKNPKSSPTIFGTIIKRKNSLTQLNVLIRYGKLSMISSGIRTSMVWIGKMQENDINQKL